MRFDFAGQKRRWMRGVAVGVLLGMAAIAAASAQTGERLRFAAGEAMAHTAELPEEILAVLREDSQVGTALDYARLEAADLPQSWFAATPVALTQGGEPAWLVMGLDLLVSDRVAPLWIVRRSERGNALVLRTAGNELAIEPESTNGLRDLRLSMPVGTKRRTTLYRFDGERYTVAREEWTTIP